MGILRKVKCDLKGCNKEYQEINFGDGFGGWGKLDGIVDLENKTEGIWLCPEHLQLVVNFINQIEEEVK